MGESKWGTAPLKKSLPLPFNKGKGIKGMGFDKQSANRIMNGAELVVCKGVVSGVDLFYTSYMSWRWSFQTARSVGNP